MTELYPADEQLNAFSGTNDDEQGVLFIPIGQSPYHTHFYRMLYRLLDVARRAGDLRVYKDGELTFGVRAGRFADGDALREFPGATAQPLTNNAANSIYLDASGTLHVSTDGFPSPSEAPHVPLAAIATAVGTYAHADITDLRGRALLRLCDGLSAAAAQNLTALCTQLQLSAGVQADHTRTVSLQVLDAAGNALPGRFTVRVWIASAPFGAPEAAGHTVSNPTALLREIAADADYELLTDSSGAASFDLTDADGGTWSVCAALAGRAISIDVEVTA